VNLFQQFYFTKLVKYNKTTEKENKTNHRCVSIFFLNQHQIVTQNLIGFQSQLF